MADCGGMDFSRGGTILEAQIIDSKITNSLISASELASSAIINLASIDAASAQKIVDAMAGLPPENLAALAKALVAAIGSTPGSKPETTTQPELPTTIAGERTMLLGKPGSWVELVNGYVPVYPKA